MTRRGRRGLLAGVVAAMLVLPVVGVLAQEAFAVAVRGSELTEDGATQLIVSVTGRDRPESLDAGAFTVSENDQPITDLDAQPLLDSARVEVVASLLIDISGSMTGEPMEVTKAAASDLVVDLTDQGVAVGLLTFGTRVEELSAPTTDTDALVDLIDDIDAQGYTALYDGIVAAAEQLASTEGQRNLVLFSDGGDTRSDAVLEDAIDAAVAAETPIVTIALETDDLDPDALEELAERTEGRVLMAGEDDLAAAFDEVADDIASQYVLTYNSTITEPAELDIEVAVAAGATTASASFVTPNPRHQLTPSVRTPSEPALLASSAALWAGTGAAFLALLLILALMLTGSRSSAERVLAGQLERYLELDDKRAGRSGLVASHFRERMMAMVEASPRPKGFDEKLTMKLEQAAWPLRNGEFLLLSVGLALGVGALFGIVFNPLGGVLLAVVAAAGPWLTMEVRRARRQDTFLRGLPDTLQLMAGSLRAGYGVLQALDTVAKESTGPASEEFQRVITEARLGMPVEEALEAMAERIDSDDFRWVVLAINIQREVGGNLAELLDTVAETLREREMLRRQIKVLSAEGRLSAVILVALPIVLTLYLILVRPEYIGVLVTSGAFGWMMVIGASLLMGVGVLWIRKMIQIEV